jgi:hypothetical protein
MNPYLNVMFASINANNPAEATTREQAITAYTPVGARGDDGEPAGVCAKSILHSRDQEAPCCSVGVGHAGTFSVPGLP